jgi:hypothetical protein
MTSASILPQRDSSSPSNINPLVLSGNLKQDQASLEKIQKLKNSDAIGRWVKDQYKKCKSMMDPLKRQWYLNLSFYKGDQYVDYINGQLITIPSPSGKARLVVNRIKPVVRTEVSRMTSQEPTAEVVPASNDEDDILAAEAAAAVFESVRARLNLQAKLREAAWWTSVCGVSYLKCHWDKSYESEDSNGQAVYGDHCYTAVSPFNIMVPDILLTDIEDQPYVLNVFTKPIEWVKQKYPEVFKKDYTPTVVAANEIMESYYLNTKTSASSNSAKPDSSLVIEAWIKPGATPLLPNGGFITMIDDVVVAGSDQGLPYKHGQYPFAKIESIQSGTFYASSIVEDLIPVQREINRTRSQLIEARNLMARPGFFYRHGSLDPNKVVSNTGQYIDIKPGADFPQPIPMPQMPAFVEKMQEDALRDIEDLSGQHQVSKGNAPSGVTAGTAIQYLQEADNSYMATTHASVEDAMEKMAFQTVGLAIQFWDSDRLIKYVGKDGSISARYLSSANLKNGTDIRVEGGSSLPQSKAARIALFMDMMNRGFLPPKDGLELMNIPSMKAYWDLVKVDENQAKRENLTMSEMNPLDIIGQMAQQQADAMSQLPQGVDPQTNPMASQLMEQANQPMVPVNDWDNHTEHLLWHENYMKSQEYQGLPPQNKQQFELHRQKHKDAEAQQQLQGMMQQGQAAIGGGSGSGPEPHGENPSSGQNQFSAPQPQLDAQNPPQ